MATFKVTTTYRVTEYVEAPADSSEDVVIVEAHSVYIPFDRFKEVDCQVEQMVSR